MSIVSFLYKLARTANDIRAIYGVFIGKPDRFFKRAVNRQIGKRVVRKMFWR